MSQSASFFAGVGWWQVAGVAVLLVVLYLLLATGWFDIGGDDLR